MTKYLAEYISPGLKMNHDYNMQLYYFSFFHYNLLISYRRVIT